MLNLGGWEMAIVVLAALLLLGPQKLPEFARFFGKAIREVRKTTQEVKDAIDFEIEKEELNRLKEEFKSSLDPIEQELHDTAAELQQSIEHPLMTTAEHDDESPGEPISSDNESSVEGTPEATAQVAEDTPVPAPDKSSSTA
ncbi:MAG: twin-arginine translocase subunit TatB [Deltaproteobacteria bacterium]|nr:twin-arginine translocase subunit TatB [Deltaproteobacteria bacterium]MBU50066.1 twin-arginine translocase subunit TatB [Deltaproteobacteria bacterium]|tara:strand:- start:2169 stop:2594 length:426 start_codon:yes stop_codon:yes gene_type:complete